jgi:group I intron endonuclease
MSINLVIMKGYIYKIENIVSKKVYIGQTVRTVEFRWSQHQHPKSKSVALKDAIKKYGPNLFKVTTLEMAIAPSREELCKILNSLERKYIRENNSIVPNGYNLMSGGDNAFHSPESKEKIAASKRGKPRPDMLKHMSKIHEKVKKPVKCNETGQVWNSVKECAEFFSVQSKQISRVLKGQRKRLKWQFTFSYLP